MLKPAGPAPAGFRQHAGTANALSRATLMAAPRGVGRRRGGRIVAAAAGADDPLQALLAPLSYGRAFAAVAARRLGELAAAAAGEAGKAASEAPAWLQEFQSEVEAAAREGMGGGGGAFGDDGAGGGGWSGGGGSGGGSGRLPTAGAGDGAIVDELRADIAASRAVLQQLREGAGVGR
ncbi:hypothetical protein Rsub_01973 [Raphidocelis subcapitata]|uniref:Uncharacterized protein n=1 Tax=Raphidocelis subcapitata TaxID=307507 RepID=A0A2V0NP48_9CHLO|nr:hypothetical protein Rsub_01973 [Raphidocelis subcapitata]|eukprot:GBF89401.1 hypothetical protein Rsub_01973 [Raphidocelis subcapitata]